MNQLTMWTAAPGFVLCLSLISRASVRFCLLACRVQGAPAGMNHLCNLGAHIICNRSRCNVSITCPLGFELHRPWVRWFWLIENEETIPTGLRYVGFQNSLLGREVCDDVVWKFGSHLDWALFCLSGWRERLTLLVCDMWRLVWRFECDPSVFCCCL